MQFLRWRKNRPGLEVLTYTFKGHLDKSSTFQHLIIHNVTLDMHGSYRCTVKTDLGAHEAEQNLVVISQAACKFSDWRVISQPTQCREIFHFDCRNMFPKPEPSCGLWNAKLERFIRSVNVDISEEVAASSSNAQTYRVKYSGKFEIGDLSSGNALAPASAPAPSAANSKQQNNELLQYAGHLIFKCDISVPDTSWKLSLIHRMFDYQDGCLQSPLEAVERMRLNYQQYAQLRLQQSGFIQQGDEYELLKMISASNLDYTILPVSGKSVNGTLSGLNCWQKPRFGSLARLSCANKANHMKLMGTNLLQCQPSGWIPVISALSETTSQTVVSKPMLLRLGRRISKQPSEFMQHSDLHKTTRKLTNLSSNSVQLNSESSPNTIYLGSSDSSDDDSDSDNFDNNLELANEKDDDDSSSSSSEPSSTYETTTQQSKISTPLIPTKEFDFIPTSAHNFQPGKQHPNAVPPTCVSIVKTPKITTIINNIQSNANLNALSSSAKSHHSSLPTKNSPSIFTFGFSSSSSSSNSNHHHLHHHNPLILILLHILITPLIHISMSFHIKQQISR